MAPTTTTWLPRLRGKMLLLAGLLLAADAFPAVLYPNVGTSAAVAKTDWYRQCLRVKPLQAPARDRPPIGNLERCDAAELYYDTRNMESPGNADWRKVRECAFRTNDTAVLMMLYANGSGVQPNLNLATKYACSIESDANEMRSRLAHLRRMSAGDQFDLCDDISSSEMHGYCANVRERLQEKRRGGRIAVLAKTWSKKEQVGFELVTKAAHDFAQHRADYETDQSAAIRRTMQVEATSGELDQFVRDLQDFEGGKLPRFSEAEFRTLEDKMNETYRRFMAAPPSGGSYLGTIRKAGVEKTQHVWLAFRDAMELFGSMKYPQADRKSVV